MVGSISETLVSRYFQIKDSLSLHSPTSEPFLSNFDWKLHLTMSSDKLSTLSRPTLLLNLSLSRATLQHSPHSPTNESEKGEGVDGEEGRKKVVLELSRKDLDTFISSLEKINKAMWKLEL